MAKAALAAYTAKDAEALTDLLVVGLLNQTKYLHLALGTCAVALGKDPDDVIRNWIEQWEEVPT
jgi:hypothetical protein